MITQLIRKELQDRKMYKSSSTLEDLSKELRIPVEKIIKLDSGENPYVEELQDKDLLQEVKFYTYPDPFCQKLRSKLALYTGFGSEWIICGNGSDELIDLLIRTFVSPEEEIIINPPTFPMYEFYGRLSGAEVKDVLRKEDLTINTSKVLAKITSKTKIIFIDSPGNPTSVIVSPGDIRNLLTKKIIVVVDEAYYEYCNKTVVPLVKNYPNLVVLRSFSKWAGLAGLRLGYMIADPKIVDLMLSIKAPYNVNVIAQKAAVSILDAKEKILKEIKKTVSFRDKFIEKLSQYKQLKVYPSEGAYIIFKPESKAVKIQEFLQKNGVLVKLVSQPLLENCIRVNIVRGEEINKLISLLRRFYENKLFDYHTQTLEHGFNKPLLIEETIQSAIDRGLEAICLTDHYPLPPEFGDPTDEKDCTMPLSLYPAYLKKIAAVKKKYGRRIEILVGAEFDWLPNYLEWIKQQLRSYPFDYAMGSVHFSGVIRDEKGKRNFIIDYSKEEFLKGASYYKNIKSLIRTYYSTVQNMVKSRLFDSIGHLDLVKKYNDGSIFSEDEEWYRSEVLATLDTIASSGMVMEINTSGFNTLCKSQYPSLWILQEARKRNIPATVGSDAHTPERVGDRIEEAIELAKLAGYRTLVRFKNREKIEVQI